MSEPRMLFNPNGWTTLQKSHVLIELTRGELLALVAAADSYLLAGADEECRVIFGSEQGTDAAARAVGRLKSAGRAIRAFSK